MSGRPPGAAAWIRNTKGTVKPSKTFSCIRWLALPENTYAAILPGKQILGDEPEAASAAPRGPWSAVAPQFGGAGVGGCHGTPTSPPTKRIRGPQEW